MIDLASVSIQFSEIIGTFYVFYRYLSALMPSFYWATTIKTGHKTGQTGRPV